MKIKLLRLSRKRATKDGCSSSYLLYAKTHYYHNIIKCRIKLIDYLTV